MAADPRWPRGGACGAGWGGDRGGGRVLLIRRRDNDRWDVPGGGVTTGEPVEEAACRELREEAGLRLSPQDGRLLGVFSGPLHRHTYPDGNTVDWVTVVYEARLTTQPAVQAADAAEARRWPLEALPGGPGEATLAYLDALRAHGEAP